MGPVALKPLKQPTCRGKHAYPDSGFPEKLDHQNPTPKNALHSPTSKSTTYFYDILFIANESCGDGNGVS